MADKINLDSGFHYYCEKHKTLSVKTLLYKLSCFQKFNDKLKHLLEEFTEISNYRPEDLLKSLETQQLSNEQSLLENRVPIPTPELRLTTRRGKRKNTSAVCEVPEKQPCDGRRDLTVAQPVAGGSKTIVSTRQTKIPIQNVPAQQETDIDETTPRPLIRSTAPQNGPTLTQQASSLRPQTSSRLRIAQKPPKFKSIYLSGLDLESTVDEIISYLSESLGGEMSMNLRVFKLNCRSRYFTSFKIICPENHFVSILDVLKEDGLKAHEFIYKQLEIITPLPLPKN